MPQTVLSLLSHPSPLIISLPQHTPEKYVPLGADAQAPLVHPLEKGRPAVRPVKMVPPAEVLQRQLMQQMPMTGQAASRTCARIAGPETEVVCGHWRT